MAVILSRAGAGPVGKAGNGRTSDAAARSTQSVGAIGEQRGLCQSSDPSIA